MWDRASCSCACPFSCVYVPASVLRGPSGVLSCSHDDHSSRKRSCSCRQILTKNTASVGSTPAADVLFLLTISAKQAGQRVCTVPRKTETSPTAGARGRGWGPAVNRRCQSLDVLPGKQEEEKNVISES